MKISNPNHYVHCTVTRIFKFLPERCTFPDTLCVCTVCLSVRQQWIWVGRNSFIVYRVIWVVFALCKFSEKNAKIKHYLSIKSQKCHTFSQSSSSTNWSIPKSDTMLNWGSVALSGILQIFHLELDDCTLGQNSKKCLFTDFHIINMQ